MQHCIITPTKHINNPTTGWQSDFLLVLSHLLNSECDNAYAKEVLKFKETWKRIYLDNGLFENHIPEWSLSLLKKAILIQADYVFAPDHLYKRKETEIDFSIFVDLAKEIWFQWKLAFVVQADNAMDYIKSFEWANNNPDVWLIWLSILSVPKSFGWKIHTARMTCMNTLHNLFPTIKDCHMLWLWDSVIELRVAKNYPWIISNDSCSAFMTGLHRKQYKETGMVPGGKVQEKVNFEFNEELDQIQRYCIESNILTIKNLLQE